MLLLLLLNAHVGRLSIVNKVFKSTETQMPTKHSYMRNHTTEPQQHKVNSSEIYTRNNNTKKNQEKKIKIHSFSNINEKRRLLISILIM